jgi:putative ABC transport system substrate-binding protein
MKKIKLMHYWSKADRKGFKSCLCHVTISLMAALTFVPTKTVAADSKSILMVLWRGETEVEIGFRAYMAERDLPVRIDTISVARDLDRIPNVLARIAETNPDLVYTWGTPLTLAIAGRDPNAVNANEYQPKVTDRPIVFSMVSQPEISGIVDADLLTGRNVTGVSHIVPMETQVQAMLAYMPVDRIATIFTETEVNSVNAVNELKSVGEQFNLRVDTYAVPLDTSGQPLQSSLPDLIALAASSGPQFLYLGPDSFLGEYAQEITDLTNAIGLPTFASTERSLNSSDALYGLVAPYNDVGRLAAQKVEQVLFDNQDPGTIAIETLPNFSYRIRLDVARQLGAFPAMELLDYAEIEDRSN